MYKPLYWLSTKERRIVMQMIPVVSSNLQAVGYEDSKLFITFNSGATYVYLNVPEYEYKNLLAAPSKGQYHAQNIKNAYQYQRV